MKVDAVGGAARRIASTLDLDWQWKADAEGVK